MDAIEAARRRAASIHSNAVADGSDPWLPLELVLREVERAGFAAEPIEPGALQLDGALAKFLPDIGLILYSDEGTPFHRAFLIAHELGHALLGDAAGVCEVDFDRPAEAAAEGEERVVAHGPRQRREIQMDMFARELLMPRPFVRKWHVEGEFTCDQLAARLGAPSAVVAQQLFDALLIPDVDVDPPAPAHGLSKTQRDAAEHPGPYLLEAGPGTGKTEALVARVAWLLRKGVDPRKILVLTYSNKAAAELSERIAGDNSDALAAMWIGTFHAFGYDLLNIFGSHVRRSKNARLLDRAGEIEMLEHELPRLGLRHLRDIYDPTQLLLQILSAISRAQDEVCGPEKYRELAERALKVAEALDQGDETRGAAIYQAEEAIDIAKVYARYQQLKDDKKLLDFGDLVMLAVEILEDVPDAQTFIDRYEHVLVDEYQDVNEASVRLLKALCPEGKGLWVVGDGQQSIYRFRGASSRNMARFRKDFPDAKTSRLVLNYRSRPEIVGLISQFGKSMTRKVAEGEPTPPAFEPLGAHQGNCGIKPRLTVVRDKSKVSPAIADHIAQAVSSGGAYRDHCVLVSGNDRLADHGAELESMGIPVLFLGSLFERAEIKELLSFLTLLQDPWGAGLLRVAHLEEFAMGLPDVSKAIMALRNQGHERPDWINGPEDIARHLSPAGADALQRLAQALAGIDPYAHPASILADLLLNRTRIAARMAQRDDALGRASAMAVWQFLNFTRAQSRDGGGTIQGLISRIRRLLRLSDDRELRQLPAAAKGIDAVRLLTIHGAKGLQFHTVHLPGLNEKTLPKPFTPFRFPLPEGTLADPRGTIAEEMATSHDEEQDCLFYVALSRAKERLHLYRTSHETGRDRPRSPSSFIKRLGSHLDSSPEFTPSRELQAMGSKVAVELELPATWHVQAWQIEMYEKCPRRFLYQNLLRTGGGVDKSTHRQANDIARDVCASLSGESDLPDAVTIEAMVARACAATDIAGHGHADEIYQAIQGRVQRYVASRAAHELEPVRDFEHWAGATRISARPHEILKGPDGRVIRIIRTGHYREDDAASLSAKLILARASVDMPDARVELVHLGDDTAPLSLSLRSGDKKRFETKASKVTEKIRSGDFPSKPNAARCSACPALLVCEALPAGKLDCAG